MSAERLREAATILREVATGATPGPWFVDDLYRTVTGKGYKSAREAYDREHDDDDDLWVIPESMDSGADGGNLHYIATMSPPVALALADWLIALANQVAVRPRDKHITNAALRVADAILGTPA